MKTSAELLPHDIYELHLVTINDIKFTPREIDIIACLAHGKSVKGISHFLSTEEKPIGTRSVETHINNLRRKVSGSSKENIIEFVEESNKYQVVRNYYSSLLLQKGFEKTLGQVAEALQPANTPFLIVSLQKDKNFRNELGNILYKYFQLSGARITKNIKYNIEELSFVFSNNNKMQQNLIFILPSECRITSEESISLDGEEVYIPREDLANALFLFYPDSFQEEKQSETHFQRIMITNPCKPYLLFFKTLKHFFPNTSELDEVAQSFISKYQNLDTFPIENKSQQTVKIRQVKNKKTTKDTGGFYYIFIVVLIVIIIGNFLINI